MTWLRVYNLTVSDNSWFKAYGDIFEQFLILNRWWHCDSNDKRTRVSSRGARSFKVHPRVWIRMHTVWYGHAYFIIACIFKAVMYTPWWHDIWILTTVLDIMCTITLLNRYQSLDQNSKHRIGSTSSTIGCAEFEAWHKVKSTVDFIFSFMWSLSDR